MPPQPPPQPELSPRARHLLLELNIQRAHHGAGAMVKDKDLAKSVHAPERDIVDLAGELIDAGHLVMASCDSNNPGRCLLKRGDDLQPALDYLESLHERGVKILSRERRFRDALEAAGAGQLNLPLEEPA